MTSSRRRISISDGWPSRPTNARSEIGAGMKLPESVKAIRSRYVDVYSVPVIQSAESPEAFEQRVRQWTLRLISQVAYELPHQGWGVKSRPNNGPISKDGIAQSERTASDWSVQQFSRAPVTLWDLHIGTGS